MTVIETETETANAEYLATIEAMRSPDVTSGNSATVWARATFARLLAKNDEGLHAFTVEMAVIAVCEVYKPKTAKGKRANTKGALKDSGFPAMSARLTTIERIMKQAGVTGVLPILDSFIASDKPKASFALLDLDVKAAIKAATPKPDKVEGEGEGEGEGEEAKPLSISDKVNAFAAILQSLSDSDAMAFASDIEALTTLTKALNDAVAHGNALLDAATAPLANAA